MKVDEKKRIRWRIRLVALCFLATLMVILGRAYQLQILEKERLDEVARNNYIDTIKLPSKRGTIYDRKGRELAMSVEVASVYAHPRQIKEKGKTAQQLAKILERKESDVLGLLNSGRPFVWVERRIPPAKAETIKQAELKGVGITTEIKRFYPGKESGAQLIGFVGDDNQGLEGLEKQYDSFLKGPQCSLIEMRDALGRPFSVSEPIYSGGEMHDLVLTIDKDIQFKAQESLGEAVAKSNAKGGSCLVANPMTGEILAMAVAPEFNPNIFGSYDSIAWRNRAVTDCFEPGSTMKAFLVAAGLEEGAFSPATFFDCEQGKYKIGRRTIHDTHKHGVISVSEIIMCSSNIGGVKMGQRVGYAKFSEYLQKFGFGRRIGSDFLGEREGFIRPAQRCKPIDQATLFFGQGMTGTSLQVAMAMAAIANGGKLMRPYAVKSIVDRSGKTIKNVRPQVLKQVLSETTCRKVARILEGVVSEDGTARLAAIDGFRVAGKTGTSQKVDPGTRSYSHTKYVAAFVGFVPVDDPKLLIMVTVDEPVGIHYGGLVAGPVFRNVGQWSLNHLRIIPRSSPDEKKIESLRWAETKPDTSNHNPPALEVEEGKTPDFKGMGMREVLKKGRSLGLKVCLEGTGLAVNQTPAAGAPLEEIRMVKVVFEPPGQDRMPVFCKRTGEKLAAKGK
jgi:cell division protein FtsI (penicillin-binding protein 3)